MSGLHAEIECLPIDYAALVWLEHQLQHKGRTPEPSCSTAQKMQACLYQTTRMFVAWCELRLDDTTMDDDQDEVQEFVVPPTLPWVLHQFQSFQLSDFEHVPQADLIRAALRLSFPYSNAPPKLVQALLVKAQLAYTLSQAHLCLRLPPRMSSWDAKQGIVAAAAFEVNQARFDDKIFEVGRKLLGNRITIHTKHQARDLQLHANNAMQKLVEDVEFAL
jgi:hypothetical protein